MPGPGSEQFVGLSSHLIEDCCASAGQDLAIRCGWKLGRNVVVVVGPWGLIWVYSAVDARPPSAAGEAVDIDWELAQQTDYAFRALEFVHADSFR